MSLAAPPPVSTNPLVHALRDLRSERARTAPLPPGDLRPSLRRTQAATRDPLGLLLDAHERHGRVFTLRILHASVVFMLGPEANHYITVSHAENFSWRDGSFGDLLPLLGDGMLTIDGDYHRRSRKIMLPAFHRERIAAATDTMLEETARALDGWRDGEEIDVYHWTRALALRIAMRALFGFDPDRIDGSSRAADEFETALSFYGHDYVVQILRGPGTPFRRMQRARRHLDRLIYSEIARRRETGERGEDILSMLLDAHDEDGRTLTSGQIRDQVMTLLFAGHDTTTSTVAFLFHELSRHPEVLERILDEQDRVLGGRAPTFADLATGLPELEMAFDETLRLYPPAWIGPRRCREEFEFDGHRVPADTYVNYCSWASHRLPDVFPEPDAFRPERFAPEEKAKLPKGAYVPFGGGSRTCIGMRFGQLEIKAIATLALQRARLEATPGYELRIRQMPTLSPRGGLPMRIAARR